MEGKDVIIIDDMISSGDSMLEVASELKRKKARKIFVAATFGLFTNGLKKFDDAYERGIIDMYLQRILRIRLQNYWKSHTISIVI